MTSQPTGQPDPTPLMSARSLIRGQGHPSQASRLRQPWRLDTSGQVFGVRRAMPADLPAVMGTLVRSSALSRWQWRRSRGGTVPSLSEMSAWLTRRGSLVVLAPGRPGYRAPRVVALAGLGPVDCAGLPVGHAAQAEVLVADPWQQLGIGRALIRAPRGGVVAARATGADGSCDGRHRDGRPSAGDSRRPQHHGAPARCARPGPVDQLRGGRAGAAASGPAGLTRPPPRSRRRPEA